MSLRRATRPLIYALLFGIGLIGILLAVGIEDVLLLVVDWLEARPRTAPLLFILVHALAVVLLIPGILFPLASGFLFGAGWGTVISIAGKTLGSFIAFLISKHFLRGRTVEFLLEHPKLRVLDRQLPKSGWKMVLLIRLVPVIPYKLSNYLFGLTRFGHRSFLLGTLIGTIPFSFLNAYIGSLAASLTHLGRRPPPADPLQWTLYIGGLVVAVVAAIVIIRVARQELLEASTPAGPLTDS